MRLCKQEGERLYERGDFSYNEIENMKVNESKIVGEILRKDREKGFIIDVGANVGNVSKLFAEESPENTVIVVFSAFYDDIRAKIDEYGDFTSIAIVNYR